MIKLAYVTDLFSGSRRPAIDLQDVYHTLECFESLPTLLLTWHTSVAISIVFFYFFAHIFVCVFVVFDILMAR